MVGHTHEDIDGLLGVLAHKLQNQNAFTTTDMNSLFAQAGKSASNDLGGRAGVGIDNGFTASDGQESRHWRCIADWRQWLEVNPCLTQLLPLYTLVCSGALACNTHVFCAESHARVFRSGHNPFHRSEPGHWDQRGHKLRVHSLLVKMHNGRACVYWKEFMRDDTWLPEDGVGWPIFKENVDLDLETLTAMPTKPISGLGEVEKRVRVSAHHLLFEKSLLHL